MLETRATVEGGLSWRRGREVGYERGESICCVGMNRRQGLDNERAADAKQSRCAGGWGCCLPASSW